MARKSTAQSLGLSIFDPPLEDRMARFSKNPQCPSCAAQPVVCVMRRPGHAVFRCRECGHKWEVKAS